MFRRPATWIILVIVSVACTVFAFRYFTQAFPIVNLDLQMDRESALEFADQLAQERGWEPSEEYRQAASFGVDSQVQTFIELEAGGREAFLEMMERGHYIPYQWTVRHFREGETNEAFISFTPSGSPYGFRLVLPEDEPGASLSSAEALAIVERDAPGRWNVDFQEYELVEESEEVLPGGRTDYTFVYERQDESIGEGRYRLRVVVAGDRLSQLTRFVKVPEAFSRRYEEMRSANEALSFGAVVAFGLLYLVGGCIVGLFLLLRHRWVLWKKALLWGLFIAFLQLLVGINQLPLVWMSYDTAVSASGFLLEQIIQTIAGSLALGGILVISFMAAEGLTRKAFPEKIQFWKIWSLDNASSPAVLGQTMAGYLLVGVFFAYEVALYFTTSRYLDWWTPSEALFHPDTLATYFPWLNSIALSAQAGFWEECLFRAVPLAGAALIGKRLGRPKLWIAGAFILQAIIFGAAHANYPAQPAYARLVELIIPSFGFAALYLLFGLLPAIILHFAFDVVWFALPIFVSTSSGAWFDQILIVTLTLVPLWVIFWARWRKGQWAPVREDQLNRSWSPPPREEAPAQAAPRETPPASFPARVPLMIYLVGVLGFIAWIFLTSFDSAVPDLETGRKVVEARSDQYLEAQQTELGQEWEVLSVVARPLGNDDRFIWQTGGEETYEQLMGSYLAPAHWSVRYARFTGDVAERAESYVIHLSPGGEVERYSHRLPESAPGANLEEPAARELADRVLREKWNLEPNELQTVSSEPSRHPERTDWEFVFADPSYPLEEGQARLAVHISGEEVTDAYRFVHTPEEWDREQKNLQNRTQVVRFLSYVLLGGFLLSGAVLAIVSWSRGRFSLRAFLSFAGLLLGLMLIQAANSWPTLEAAFSTAQPYRLQAAIAVVAIFIQSLLMAATVGLVAGLVYSWPTSGRSLARPHPIGVGLALAASFAGLGALFAGSPSLSPTWPAFSAADNVIPLAGAALGPLTGFVIRGLFLLWLATLTLELTSQWQERRWLFRMLLLFTGFLIAGTTIETLPGWALRGLMTGAILIVVFEFVLRYQMAAAPAIVAGLVALGQVREAFFSAYPGALAGSILSVLLILAATLIWTRSLRSGREAGKAVPAQT